MGGISKRMLIGTAITGALYFVVGEILYQALLGTVYTPLLIGLYFLGLMIFVIIGINLIGLTMRRAIRGYGDIVLRCAVLCLAMLMVSSLFEVLYELKLGGKTAEPSSYVFVMDNSGSMESNDPENKRYDGIRSVLRNKEPEFPYAVYLFANNSSVLREMGPVSQGVDLPIDEPTGGTGILTVIQNLYDDIDSGRIDLGDSGRVLLFTDGHATDMFPILGKAKLNKVLAKYSKKGVSISTVGLGSPDDELMNMIARKTGGIYVRAEDAEFLEDAMREAITSNSERNLLDYRDPVKLDFIYMLIRFVAILAVGLLLAFVKMYICEPFMDTRPVWATSVVCSLLAAVCVEFGMNKLGLLPLLMRFLMCVLLAEATLREQFTSGMDDNDIYRHYY